VVEWDVAKSPSKPNGRLVSFTLRALTPVGLRQAIVKNCGLSNGRDVGLFILKCECSDKSNPKLATAM
jgi:hypothetical protein